MKSLVSIVCITYNQKKYIQQTLDSFLMQKTSFPFEIVIHDDASTDGTAEIIQEYAKNNPGIFKVQLEEKNQYSQGNYKFIRDLYKTATGRYIAFCEGDDYWTDDTKLQQQFDFMESHPDYALCFHPVEVMFEGGEEGDSIYPERKTGFDVTGLLKENFIQTNSVMYRRQDYTGMPTEVMPGDWFTHLYHAQFGKVGFINQVMSVYRRHSDGVWWDSRAQADEIWKKHGLAQMNMFLEVRKMFPSEPEHVKIIHENISQTLRNLIRVDKKYRTSLTRELLDSFTSDLDLIVDTIISVVSEDDEIKSHQLRQIARLSELNTDLEQQLDTIRSSKYYKLYKKYKNLKR